MSGVAQKSPNHEGMSCLAETFPMLRGRRGVRPFDPEALDEMAAGPEGTTALRGAARFVLGVWNRATLRGLCRDKHGNRSALKTYWRVGPFDLFEAWSVWDGEHRRAAQAWMNAPFWP